MSTASLTMNGNSLVFISQNQIKSRHYSIRRLIIFIALFITIVIFYMMTNYLDKSRSSFYRVDYRHYPLKELTKRHMEKKKLYPIFGNVQRPLPSLMVKPLRNASRSHTVQQITEENLKKLFKVCFLIVRCCCTQF